MVRSPDVAKWAREGVPDVVDGETSDSMVRVLVVGGASCVWDDLERVPDGWATEVICVNDVGAYYDGEFRHWASLHPDKFPGWWAVRQTLDKPKNRPTFWGRTVPAGVDPGPVDAVVDHWGGSSAGLAVRIALQELGADEVVMAGCPQTHTPHFHTPRAWQHWDVYWRDWERLAKEGKLVNVRSLSGRTRELLGRPEWDT